MEKTREKIEKQYKWDIEAFIKKEQVESLINQSEELCQKVQSYKGKIMQDSQTLYNFYQDYEKLDQLQTNLYVYSHMLCDQNTQDTTNQALKMKIDKLVETQSEKTSFITPEMLKTPYEEVLSMIKENPKLEIYQFDLEKVYRYQPYTLSEKEEELITKAKNAMGTGEEAFYNLDNADIHLGKIQDEEGKLVELTNSNYIKYMISTNRNVRKNAFENMYQYWSSLKNTVASTLKGTIKENFFTSNIRGYKNPLEASLYRDNINSSVYYKLIEIVHKNLDKMYEYVQLRKKILKVEELHMYDIYVDLIEEKEQKFPFEEGKKIIFEALKPLGDTYLKDLNKAFDEHWIDIYPNIGKKSGAYSWGTYHSYPYLLLNYNDTRDAVSTMVHELGHSMHSYYSKQNQPYTYHSYPIFLAEIASTVNEILLNEYLYKNAKTKEEKALYLNDFLDKIKGTLYRQTMFAEFEMIMHNKEEQGIPLTEEEFSTTYYELNKLYFGNTMMSDELIRYEWMRIPHFYTSFYVYKYATGISAAVAIASDILNQKPNALQNYLTFLSSGCSNYPLEILKKCGVDMESGIPIQKALDMFEEKLNELKKLYD